MNVEKNTVGRKVIRFESDLTERGGDGRAIRQMQPANQ